MAEILHFVQNDRRRVQNDKHGISLIATQSPKGEDEGEGGIPNPPSPLSCGVFFITPRGKPSPASGRGRSY